VCVFWGGRGRKGKGNREHLFFQTRLGEEKVHVRGINRPGSCSISPRRRVRVVGKRVRIDRLSQQLSTSERGPERNRMYSRSWRNFQTNQFNFFPTIRKKRGGPEGGHRTEPFELSSLKRGRKDSENAETISTGGCIFVVAIGKKKRRHGKGKKR